MPLPFILQRLLTGGAKPVSEEQMITLARMIQDLPPENRIPVQLYLIQQQSRQQIALDLHWPLSKVHSKITRGITLLKKELAKNPSS